MENFRHKLSESHSEMKTEEANRTCCTILETLTLSVTPCQNTLVTQKCYLQVSQHCPKQFFCHGSDWAENISSSGFFRCLRAFVYHIRDSQKHSQSWSILYMLLSPESKLIYNQFILKESALEEHIASSQTLILSSSYFKLTQSCLLSLLVNYCDQKRVAC